MGKRTRATPGRQRGPHIRRRGGVWYLYVDRANRISLETADEQIAKARVPEYLARARRAAAARGAASPAIAVIAKAYADAPHGWTRRTAMGTRVRLTAFVEAMQARGKVTAADVDQAALDDWRTARMETRSRTTINRDEMVARSMFRWAVTAGLVRENPFADRAPLREVRRKRPPIVPSPDEVARVVAALIDAGERGAALCVATALASGLRIDELRHLRPADIDASGVSVVPETGPAASAWTSKSFHERRVPVSEKAATTAREFATWRTTTKGGSGKPVGLADTWLADRITAACEAAKVPRFTMHDLRRSFATSCVRHGVPISLVREWMGHRDVQTTERYIGRFRSDAEHAAPTPAALAVLDARPADVVPMRRRGSSK